MWVMLASRGSEVQWRVGWNETQETESLILISIISVAEGTHLTLSRLWCLPDIKEMTIIARLIPQE